MASFPWPASPGPGLLRGGAGAGAAWAGAAWAGAAEEAEEGQRTVEVPLAFHSPSAGGEGGGAPLLRMDDVGMSLSPAPPQPQPQPSRPSSRPDSSYLRGLASAGVHVLPDEIRILVSTAADPDRPDVLSVSASAAGGGGAAAARLDMSGLQSFGRAVVARTFLHPRRARLGGGGGGNGSGEALLRLVLVDTAGTVLTAFLSLAVSSTPGQEAALALGALPLEAGTCPLSLSSIPAIVARCCSPQGQQPQPLASSGGAEGLYFTPGTALSASDLAFLSPTRLVVALSPHLICVELGGVVIRADEGRGNGQGKGEDGVGAGEGGAALWTMADAASSSAGGPAALLGGILGRAGSLLAGGREDGAHGRGGSASFPSGMAPVSALAAAQHGTGTAATAAAVFTLHSDGTARLWEVGRGGSGSLRPGGVRLLRVPGEMKGGTAAAEAGSLARGRTQQQQHSASRYSLGGFFSSSHEDASDGAATDGAPGEDPPLPETADWSPGADAVLLSARLYPSSEGSARGSGGGRVARADAGTGGSPAPIDAFAHPSGLRYALAVSVSTVEDPLAEFEAAHHQSSPADPSSSDVDPHKTPQPQPSPCHLLVMSGAADAGPDLTGTDGAVPLLVPSGARSVVGLDFAPQSVGGVVGGCELQVLYRTGVRKSTAASAIEDGSALAVYPPSASTGVSHSPLKMGQSSTVDFTALAERAAILELRSGLMSSLGCSSLCANDARQAIDGACLAHLFRPVGARSLGRRHASPSAIYRAIRRLVPSYDLTSDKVEVDALLAMRECTRCVDARSVLLSIGADTGTATVSHHTFTTDDSDIYHAFASSPRKPSRVRVEGKMGDFDEDQTLLNEEASKRKGAEPHLSHWIRFLLAIHEEEAIHREPLSLLSLSGPSSSGTEFVRSAAIVRGGLTTTIIDVSESRLSSNQENLSVFSQLDDMSTSVLQYIRANAGEEQKETLACLSHHINCIIAKAGLVTARLDQDMVDSISYLGSLALHDLGTQTYRDKSYPTGSTTMAATVTSLFDALSTEEISEWLAMTSAKCSTSTAPFFVAPSFGADSSYLAKLQVAALSDLALGRCLLVLGAESVVGAALDSAIVASSVIGRTGAAIVSEGATIGPIATAMTNQDLVDSTVRSYLHVLAVQWAISQQLEQPVGAAYMDAGSRDKAAVRSEVSLSPPGARTRLGDVTRLAVASTIIEEACSRISGPGPIESIADVAFPGHYDQAMLPQLAILGPLKQPRIALRLLAPFVAYPLPKYSHVGEGRSLLEAAAESLLVEANSAESNMTMPADQIQQLRKVASQLLLDACKMDEIDWKTDLSIVFDVLVRSDYQQKTLPSYDGNAFLYAQQTLQQMVYGRSPTPSITKGIALLCNLQTTKSLLLPWIMEAGACGSTLASLVSQKYPSESKANSDGDIDAAVRALLYISNLINRVATLERLCTSGINRLNDNKGAGVVLAAIKDATSAIDDLLPRVVVESYMTEYPTLWSSAFRHAISEQKWPEGYEACLANPQKERRLSGFRRLFIAMADAGAFEVLLKMPLTVIGKPINSEPIALTMMNEDECSEEAIKADAIDLYEIAAEMLADAAFEQSRNSSIKGATNYRGCLYALHASRGNWRRASAAMNYYGVSALSKAAMNESSTPGRGSSRAPSINEEKMAIDDISLSALGSAHSIRLEELSSHRFIVKNEVGPYPTPPVFRDDPQHLQQSVVASKNKRSRHGIGHSTAENTQDTAVSDDRVARLRTMEDLSNESIRYLAIRTLAMDASCGREAGAKRNAGPLQWLDRAPLADIDALASRGYYVQALEVAKTVQDVADGALPGGRGIFCDALSFVLCKYLAPATIELRSIDGDRERYEGDDVMMEEAGVENLAAQLRPNLMQVQSLADWLQAAEKTDSMSALTSPPPPAATDGWKSRDRQYGSTRNTHCMDLLRRYTTQYSSETNTLALEVATTLLELDGYRSNLPVWLTDLLCGAGSGAGGNPPALVKLYMSRGLHVAASDVMRAALDGSGKGGGAISSHLPERGDINFFPYTLIDRLHAILGHAMNDSAVGAEERAVVKEARARLEQSLAAHLARTNHSEVGLKSARALLR